MLIKEKPIFFFFLFFLFIYILPIPASKTALDSWSFNLGSLGTNLPVLYD